MIELLAIPFGLGLVLASVLLVKECDCEACKK